ncbi:MAG: hypothetical protein WC333_00105 [Dehalococcoidia bacterium]|jgi:hypothetical protein
MKELIDDYRRKLRLISKMLDNEEGSGKNANLLTLERLKTKKGCYNATLTELERLEKKIESNEENTAYVVYNTETKKYYRMGTVFVNSLKKALIFEDKMQAEVVSIACSRDFTTAILEVKPIIIELK